MPKILVLAIEKIPLIPFIQMAIDDQIELVLAENINDGFDAFRFYDDQLSAIVLSSLCPILSPYVRMLAETIKTTGFEGQLITCNTLSQALPAIQAIASS